MRMRRIVLAIAALISGAAIAGAQNAQEFNPVPNAWKWISDGEGAVT